jgi:vacuolar-type H+-ATPase subunit H
MDVLKDVKNAEAEAARIEAEYRARADDLVATCAADLQRRRQERTAAVERELQQYRDDLRRKLADDKRAVQETGARDLEQLEWHAAANRGAAVAAVLSKLNAR